VTRPALAENRPEIQIFEETGPDGQGRIADGVVEEKQAEGELLEINLIADEDELLIRQENLAGWPVFRTKRACLKCLTHRIGTLRRGLRPWQLADFKLL
jgi:hypothetical protein